MHARTSRGVGAGGRGRGGGTHDAPLSAMGVSDDERLKMPEKKLRSDDLREPVEVVDALLGGGDAKGTSVAPVHTTARTRHRARHPRAKMLVTNTRQRT